jgi:antitoxin (DNA-binding transcriptional repressor) of toxin-antitoxin stability system
MKTVSLRELHQRTGYWARRASIEGAITITDRGQPVAVLSGADNGGARKSVPLPKRRRIVPRGGLVDSTRFVSEDRDRCQEI